MSPPSHHHLTSPLSTEDLSRVPRRKPLPPTASPLAVRFSSAEHHPQSDREPELSPSSPASFESPPPADLLRRGTWLSNPPRRTIPLSRSDSDIVGVPEGSVDADTEFLSSTSIGELTSDGFNPHTVTRPPQLDAVDAAPILPGSRDGEAGSAARALMTAVNKPPNLVIKLDDNSRGLSAHLGQYPDTNAKPRSPGNKLTSFFGWKTTSPGGESPVTNFSDRSPSPLPSPSSPNSSPGSSLFTSKAMARPAVAPKPPAGTDGSYFAGAGVLLPAVSMAESGKEQELEEELKGISAELASSIRREMDLEDMVERLQSELGPGHAINRRTSDYFSDSGTSSVRYPGESDLKAEEYEKLQRRTEQEKAQLRLELSQKVQQERDRSKGLEAELRALQEKVAQVDLEQSKYSDASAGRVKELEAAVEDLRRRLAEERQVKENFEDLLAALRGEIEAHRNERDNLREEVVPQMRARIEGLEAAAAEAERLTYDNTRMQQELQSLRNENTTLVNARKMQLEMQQHSSRFTSISEEDETGRGKIGLTRANTTARSSHMGSRTGSLSRSTSVKEKRESKESLADRFQDIEAQRDALHRALKSLLERQELQAREHNKRVRVLEAERDYARSASPRRLGFDKEVSFLREQINQLRRRADDALDQKWQCEKGLTGLNMDLDRAQQETSSLRSLLQEHDISVPDLQETPSLELNATDGATSASLEKAYKELQAMHALSLASVRELEDSNPSSASGADAQKILVLLKKSISDAEAERDFAQKQAEQYRLQAESLKEAEKVHLGEEQSLASQLRASATRVEELATQIRLQLESNNTLRQRLADAIVRGDREQKMSADQINDLQGKLKSLEERLMAASQQSEEAVAKHEEEMKDLRESHNVQLQRIKNGLKSPTMFSPKAPMSPLFANRSPRLDKTTSGLGISITEASKADFLERRVRELERALSDADKEMEEVVGRMNLAQIEVAELQSERDLAMRQTRRLQAEIAAEKAKVKALVA